MTRPATQKLLAASAAALAAALLFIVYLRLSNTVIVGSDGATIALQGWDILHGNVLLHGWATSDVSFYPAELLEYALLERLTGLGPEVVHVAGALTYTILVVLAALVAKGETKGPDAAVRILIAVGIMLAPAPGFGVSTLLLAPDHFGSAVLVLLAWLVVDRWKSHTYVPVAVGAILTVGVIADPLAEVIGVMPMMLLSGLRAYQHARRHEPWSVEASVAVAAAAAVGIATIVLALIRAAGGFTSSPVQTGLPGLAALPHNFFLAGQGILLLFGASFVRGQPVNMLFSVLHLVSVAMVAAAFVIAAGRVFRRDELLVPGLAVAITLNLAVYIASRYPADPLSTREISAVLPLASVLAARILAAHVLRIRLVPLLSAVLAGYAVTLGLYANQPRVPALHQDLADWLVTQHLSSGVSPDYWLSSITTVDSGGRARVTWVSAAAGGITRPPPWHTKDEWYRPDRNHADFLVTDALPGSAAWRSAVAAARASFGPPARIRSYRQYTIMIWARNVLVFFR